MEQRLPFHRQLKLERDLRGWSQAELAKRVGVNVKTVRRWESGESHPQPYYRPKLSELLGKSFEELGLLEPSVQPKQTSETPSHKEDWGDAPRGIVFYGREAEQTKLQKWMTEQHARIIAIVGIGGIGKTSLTAKTVMRLNDSFTAIFWRSLRNAPPLEQFLQQCLQFLLFQPQLLPKGSDDLTFLLLQHLRTHRCLLVLDNFESLFQSGQNVGHYREGYEQYGQLLRQLGETEHQSCLLLTSREKPREITQLEGKSVLVRSLPLTGIGQSEGKELLKEKDLLGTAEHWARLVQQYSGNPLALQIVAEPIQILFAGDIARFLQEDELAFDDVTDLLNQQFQRLAPSEREILYWLAIEREAVSLEQIQENLVHPVSKGELFTTLHSLGRRFLFEQPDTTHFTLQPVIQEYITNEIIRHACDEFVLGTSATWHSYTFLKAQAKEYIRESQKQLLLAPIAQRLLSLYGQVGLEQRIQTLLAHLRLQSPQRKSYMGGNVLNLLIFCEANLSAFDFSRLPIHHAYLQDVALLNVNFCEAYFQRCVFTNTFGDILSVSFSPDGQLLAAGTSNGEIWLYSLPLQNLVGTLQGHTDGVWSVTFSPDGKRLASGSDDQTIRLWDQETGLCLQTLSKHTNRVRAVRFSPDSSMLASSGEDQIIHLWSMPEGTCLRTLVGHTGRVWSVDFSPDGNFLASGGTDKTVRTWEVASGTCLTILSEHTHWIRSVRFSPDGRLLASASDDKTVRVWDWQQVSARHVLQGHVSGVWSLAFTPDGQTLISGSEHANIRLWDLSSGMCSNVFQGHRRGIRAIAVDSRGQWLASGGADQAIHLWELSTGVCLKVFRGYTNRIWHIDICQSVGQLASCSEDGSIRLWDISTGRHMQTLQSHAHRPRCVALHTSGTLLASSGEDQTVRIWDLTNGQCRHVLHGHTTWVRTVAFSPDGLFLATGGEDGIIYVWDMSDPTKAAVQQCLILREHTNWIRTVAFQPQGDLLASGGDDQTVRLWNRHTGQCIQTLSGHSGRVREVAFSPDGKLLASGSEDCSIRLWDLTTWNCIAVLEGHVQRIMTLAFSPDGKWLASGSSDATIDVWSLHKQSEQHVGQIHVLQLQGHKGQIRSICFHAATSWLTSASEDGSIKLWNIKERPGGENPAVEATCVNILSSGWPYEGMNITGAQGLTEARKRSLLALGAVDDESMIM